MTWFSPELLLVGISARWLLASARRAGFACAGIDAFADWDAQQIAPLARYRQFSDIPQMVAPMRPHAILVGGGLETHLPVVEQLRGLSPLLNLPSATCKSLKDPGSWGPALLHKGISVPLFQYHAPAAAEASRWLEKQIDSAGGTGVALAEPGRPRRSPRHFFQRKLNGNSASVTLLFEQGSFQILGFFRQLIGTSEFGGSGFQYCGAIGPLPLTDAQREQIHQIGAALASAFELNGVVGVDLIETPDQLWPIEINPRLTATGELLERSSTFSLVGRQAACFGVVPRTVGAVPFSSAATVQNLPIQGKAILRWTRSQPLVVHPRHREWLEEGLATDWLADIPHPGTVVSGGQPILTIFAAANSADDCFRTLCQRAAQVYRRWDAPERDL